MGPVSLGGYSPQLINKGPYGLFFRVKMGAPVSQNGVCSIINHSCEPSSLYGGVCSAMPLISIWTSNPSAVMDFTIEQVVSAAGDGFLKDESECSVEIREYISQITSQKIETYIKHCLSNPFQKSGFVLQDLVNELGRRLEFSVDNGRYQGRVNAVGCDGVWTSPEGQSIVVEVKTTDAYRLSLDVLSEYRRKLIESDEITDKSSVLIVVGREETGEIEAQIRGSRHAWDIRLISADSLINLVGLKENTEYKETAFNIRNIFSPLEYTSLDNIVDVLVSVARDVASATESEAGETGGTVDSDDNSEKANWDFTDSLDRQQQRESAVRAISRKLESGLIKKGVAMYWNPSRDIRVACVISKQHKNKGDSLYWYGYSPEQDEFLDEGNVGFFVLGCMDMDTVFAIPLDTLRSELDYLHTTTRPDGRSRWHVTIVEPSPGSYALKIPKKGEVRSLDEFIVKLPEMHS